MEVIMMYIRCILISAIIAFASAAETPAPTVPTAPPELLPMLARCKAGLKAEEVAYHLAQAKVKETAVADFEKLLKAESRVKGSTMVAKIEEQIAALKKEIVLLKNPILFQVMKIDELLTKKKLTAEDWNEAPGNIFSVSAKEARNSTKIKVTVGQMYYVIPNPADTWQNTPTTTKINYLGAEKDPSMKLVIRCGEKEISGFWISEPGLLTIGPSLKNFETSVGAIRVKIVRLR